MNIYITVSLLFLSFPLFSQKKQIVVLNDTGEPIPYVNVLINKTDGIGFISDSNGIITLKEGVEKLIMDSVIISCIGYSTLSLNENEFLSSATIKLKQSKFLLNEFIVSSEKPKTFLVGSHKAKGYPGYFYEVTGSEVALFIPATIESTGRKIKKLYAFISKEGIPTSDFRIIVYSSNQEVVPSPSKILIDENIILNAKKGNEWVSFNISKHNVKFPKSGIFISIMWLNSASEFTYFRKRKFAKDVEYKQSGQVLKGVCNDEKSYLNSAWRRNTLLDQKWTNKKEGMQPLVKCELIK